MQKNSSKPKKQGSIKNFIKGILIIIVVLICCLQIYYIATKPSHNRVWRDENALIPIVEIQENIITIQNIRNATYDTNGRTSLSWYNDTFNVTQLENVWFIQEPFALWGASAHTFVTFGFTDGRYISVSVEARFEENESYSAVRGLFDTYELWYVWGSEEDLIARRTNWLKEDMYLYPMNASEQTIQALFVEMATYTQRIEQKPQFYNTLANTCTSSLADRVEAVAPGKVGITIATLLPGYSDVHLYKKGLINTTLPFEEIRSYYNITAKGQKSNMSDFSKDIRILN